MLDTRANTIIYHAQNYVVELVAGIEDTTEKSSLIARRKFGKAKELEWEKADLIISLLEAYEEIDKLDDKTEFNYVLDCLIELCNLFDLPVAPTIVYPDPPTILTGLPGEDGNDGARGPRGYTGLATDFSVSLISVLTTVDSFPVEDAKGARWDYTITESGGAQRSGSVIGTWSTDGTNIAYYDTSTNDIVDSTEDLVFSVELVSGEICLRANPASGTWTVVGSRYFIPNNGNGTGPISDNLSDGYVYIGNSSNVAQERLLSGDITITNTGVAAITAGVIVNADINASAAISVSKLAALTASRVAITDASGFLSTSSVTPTTLGYLDIGSSLTSLLGAKLTDPTTTSGDIIIRNNLNAVDRLAAGTNGQVLTISGGIPTWATPGSGFADPMTTIGDLIRRDGSNNTNRLPIGSTGQVLTVVAGLPAWASTSTTGVTTASGTTYSILTTDNIVHATNTGVRAFTLPLGSLMTEGKIIWVKDAAGNASTNSLTVDRGGSDTFEDGSTSFVITGDYSVIGFYWGSSRWNVI